MKKVTDGLVLRVFQSGDNDRTLTVLAAEGKLRMTAKGSRSTHSKVASLCRIFTYSNIEFYEKNGLRWISGGSVNCDFSKLSSDISGYALASYILQLADEITGENCPAEDVLRMTLNTLYAIERKLKPLWQIKSAYEIFAADISGFLPDLGGCCVCGKSNSEDGLWLDVMNGGLICDRCRREQNSGLPLPNTDSFETRNILMPLDSASLEAMRYVSKAPLERIFSFSLSEARSHELLSRASECYLLNHLERDFNTLEFYHSVKED